MAPRVGIAGYGLAGRIFHAPLLKGAGFDVVGVVTNNPARKNEALSDFPNIQIASTIEELFKLKLDLFVVASVNSEHLKQAISGLKAGIPVIVDKPMGRNLKEVEEIIRLSKQLNVPVTTFFNRKWDSDALTIKKVISEGILGNIFRLDSRFERFRPELSKDSWREHQSAADGGGCLLDLQPHLLSTALDWFGPAKLVAASVRTIRGAADDDNFLVLKHDSGVDSYLSASAVIGSPGPRVRVAGDRASLIIKDLDPQEALLRRGLYPAGGKWSESTKSAAFLHYGEKIVEYRGVDGNYAQFYIEVKAALSGSKWPVTTDEVLAVAKIIDQAREISFR